MLNFFKGLGIARKMDILIGIALLGIVVLSAGYAYSVKYMGLEGRQGEMRQSAEVAYGVLEHYHTLVTLGKLSEAEAKESAKGMIGRMRHNRDEYFWINDSNHRIVLHPIRPELIGKDMTDDRDSDGNYLFREFVKTAHSPTGEGFVTYSWPKPGTSEPVGKLSYVKMFEPWDWIIGTGGYIDGIEAMMWKRLIPLSMGIAAFGTFLFFFGLYVSRSITIPIRRAVGIAKTIASGDLSMKFEDRENNETGQLIRALSEMNEALNAIVTNVREGSDSIAVATQQIAVGNKDLSSRTESQASTLEETAASMEALSSKVRLNGERTLMVNAMVTDASGIAAKTGELVVRVVETMRSIDESSSKVAEIISVIDGIAFQTNILAFNAAVEASRAGEQGRSFSVVAAEIRALAQKSAMAAKEIKRLILSSTERVNDGMVLVDKTGNNMKELVFSVDQVESLMRDISNAGTEQTNGIAEIHQALSHLDSVTQQNAALVEEAAAASDSLETQTRKLMDQVSVFRVGNA